MKCFAILLFVALVMGFQHFILYPNITPLYRKHFGHMMKYSDDIIRAFCSSISGTSNIDEIFIKGEMTKPFTSVEQAQEFQKLSLKSATKIHRQAIYIGNLCASVSERMISSRGITHILNVCDKCPPKFFANKSYFSLDIPTEETGDARIASLYMSSRKDEMVDFIKTGLQTGGSVMITSTRGASRSVYPMVAYLMKELNWKYEEAMGHVMAWRPSIEPSQHILSALKQLESEIKASNFPEL